MSYVETLIAVRDDDDELTVEPYSTTENGAQIKIVARRGGVVVAQWLIGLQDARALRTAIGKASARARADAKVKP